MGWDNVETALPGAQALATDGCHKIYLLMDAEQVEVFREYGYGSGDDGSLLVLLDAPEKRHAASSILRGWFHGSCGLRFIDSVKTVDGDPNKGFTTLIGQFEFDDDEEG